MCSGRINQPVLKREIKVLSQHVSVCPLCKHSHKTIEQKGRRISIRIRTEAVEYTPATTTARFLKFSFEDNLGQNVLHEDTTSIDSALIFTSSKETEAEINM